MYYMAPQAIDVGGGMAAIGSLSFGNGNGKFNIPALFQSAHFWSWFFFFASIAWLLGLFAAFGGYKGDVAS